MFKYSYGPITNTETNESKNIEVNLLSASNAKDTAIGMGLILLGGVYLCVSMFKNGSNAFEQSGLQTFDDLHLI